MQQSRMPVANLQNLIVALDRRFLILQFLYVGSPNKHRTTLILPETLRVPHLLHIGLENFAFSIQSPLLHTAFGLKTLASQYPAISLLLPNSFTPATLPYAPTRDAGDQFSLPHCKSLC